MLLEYRNIVHDTFERVAILLVTFTGTMFVFSG